MVSMVSFPAGRAVLKTSKLHTSIRKYIVVIASAMQLDELPSYQSDSCQVCVQVQGRKNCNAKMSDVVRMFSLSINNHVGMGVDHCQRSDHTDVLMYLMFCFKIAVLCTPLGQSLCILN